MKMRTLDKYVARNFLHSYVLCLAVMMGLRLGADLFVNVDDFAEAAKLNSTTSMAAHMFSYYATHSLVYFQELAGIVLAAAAAFCLARMNHSNELTAVLASGTSMYRVILPVLVAAMGLSALSLVDQEVLIPRFKERLALRRNELPETMRMRIRLLQDARKQVWYSENYQAATQRMATPLVLARDEQAMLVARISGSWAQYVGRHRWRVADGVIVRRPQWTAEHSPSGWQTITAGFVPTPLATTILAAAGVDGAAAAGELAVTAKAASPEAGLLTQVSMRIYADADRILVADRAEQPLAALTADLAVQGRRGNEPGFFLVGSPDVDANDFTDLGALCRRLIAEDRRDTTDSFGHRLWLALPTLAKQRAAALAELAPSGIKPADRADMAQAITAALHWGRLIKPGDVPGALLADATMAALGDETTSRLNRLVLDLNYPGLINASGGDVWLTSDLTPEEMAIRQTSDWVELMSTSEINRLLGTGKAPDPAAASMTKHLRIATPVINLVMVMVGVPFILSRERNIKASASMTVAMALSVYVTALLARQMGSAGMDPVLAAWLPVLIFGPVAVWMLDSVKT